MSKLNHRKRLYLSLYLIMTIMSIMSTTWNFLPRVPIEPGDPRWVGAWWIGLMAGGLAAMTVALFCACFPSELPGICHLIASIS